MKTCSKCQTKKPLSDYRVDGGRRRASCRACDRAVAQDWKKRNHERTLRYGRDRYLADPEKQREQSRRYRRENPKKVSESNRRFYDANSEYMRARSRQAAKDRPDLNRLRRSWRRASEKQATPSWANRKAMLAFYKEAVRLTELTGIQHHVDHIIPLQSPWVCGLHCEANLQILPYYENQSKSNRVWPDMPDLTGCSPLQIAA